MSVGDQYRKRFFRSARTPCRKRSGAIGEAARFCALAKAAAPSKQPSNANGSRRIAREPLPSCIRSRIHSGYTLRAHVRSSSTRLTRQAPHPARRWSDTNTRAIEQLLWFDPFFRIDTCAAIAWLCEGQRRDRLVFEPLPSVSSFEETSLVLAHNSLASPNVSSSQVALLDRNRPLTPDFRAAETSLHSYPG